LPEFGIDSTHPIPERVSFALRRNARVTMREGCRSEAVLR
jgi:hypothetical protein